MTDFMKALSTFMTQFGLPAYVIDCVPDDAEMPYITYTVSRPTAMGVSLLTVNNWHNKKLLGNVERARVSDAIAAAIPEKGTRIPVGNGFVVLRRGSDFQTLYQDPEDLDALSVRTSVEVYYYAM